MKNESCPTLPAAATRALMAAMAVAVAWHAAPTSLAQAPAAQQASAANDDRVRSPLTLYDRQGQVVRTLGEPEAFYTTPALSPDGTRLAVARRDEATQTFDIWVLELSTGAATRITSNPATELFPVWSPDGRQIAYASGRDGSYALYRTAPDGTGREEILYRHPATLSPTDWSPDGRFLTFFDPTGLYVLPLDGAGERTAIEVRAAGPEARGGRFSPDGRLLAYVSGQAEIWVRPFDPSAPDATAANNGPWRVSDRGGVGMIFWRQDGIELYYLAADRDVMAVAIGSTPAFTSGPPTRLFAAPVGLTGTIRGTSASRDGRRFLFATDEQQRAAARAGGSMLTVLDAQGSLVRTIGERDLYQKPAFSPDETRVAVVINYQNNAELWVLDARTGAGTRIASAIVDELSNMASFLWSPDGRRLAYVALRGSYYGIYRKSATGDGNEELLYRHQGTPLLADWSRDGRYLGFFTGERPGATMSVLPLDGAPGAREPTEILSSESDTLTGPFFSPDGGFVAYQVGESGRDSIWVRGFDPGGRPAAARTWRISDGDAWANLWDWYGDAGRIVWPTEGNRIYYLSADLDVMAVDVHVGPDFEAGRPRVLFKAPPMARLSHISRDGEQFLFAVPRPLPLNQIALFDRTGNELRRVGEPGLYGSAALSPDGARVAVSRHDPQTGR